MQVTFIPTDYTFNFDDRFFVQAVTDDKKQPFLGCFGDLSDAYSFAEVLQKRPRVNAVFIFSRGNQHHNWHRPTNER